MSKISRQCGERAENPHMRDVHCPWRFTSRIFAREGGVLTDQTGFTVAGQLQSTVSRRSKKDIGVCAHVFPAAAKIIFFIC